MNATFYPDVFNLILPEEAEQESSEEGYRSPSDEYSISIYYIYSIYFLVIVMYFLLTR